MQIRIYQLFLFFSALIFTGTLHGQDFKTPFEKKKNTTATYEECIDFYKKLADEYDELQITEVGETDSGEPLHLVLLDKDQDFTPDEIRAKRKALILINNGIHPGEPEGIDASMILLRSFLESDEKLELLDKIVLGVIPIYNVGGALNRNSHTRANQEGPESYGFRGNAKNLDLNRDFIKADSKNAEAMSKIFARWSPDVFVDNHTSNGADYPYTITLISTQKDKLHVSLSDYMTGKLVPALFAEMKKRGNEMSPYVYAATTPEAGISGFLDLPRYSTGYSALHQAIGFTVETHMLKPFEDRMWATYHFMEALIREVKSDVSTILKARERAMLSAKNKKKFNLNWEIDSSRSEQLLFKGFEAKYKTSKVTGLNRLYYDRDATWEKEIPFHNSYKPIVSVEKPIAYIIPQAYSRVIERLKWNGVKMKRLSENTEIEADFYYIKRYKSPPRPYEGHFLHKSVQTETKPMKRLFRKGDYVVFANQTINEFIIHTLEPEAADSYFAWNFFDGILQQKEYFSPYVFEEVAEKMLEEDEQLLKDFEKKLKEDESFAESSWAQLYFIYKRSPHYEPTHNLYPVGRMIKYQKLPME